MTLASFLTTHMFLPSARSLGVSCGPTLFNSVALMKGREHIMQDVLTETHHYFHVSFLESTFKVCQGIVGVSTTCFCSNGEVLIHRHGLAENVTVIYRASLILELYHSKACSELAATVFCAWAADQVNMVSVI